MEQDSTLLCPGYEIRMGQTRAGLGRLSKMVIDQQQADGKEREFRHWKGTGVVWKYTIASLNYTVDLSH